MKIAVAAAAVLGVIFALWLAMRDSSETPPAPAPKMQAPPSAPAGQPSVTVTPADQPRLPDEPGSAVDPSKTYIVGDVNIRDHRHGDSTPRDLPPNIHPPDARELPSTLTHAISQKLRQVMLQCIADLPREARGPQPKLEGTIFVAIKNHKLSVIEDEFQLRDVVGAAVEPVKSCISTRAVGLDTPATDQEDIDRYSIGVTFALP